MEEVKDVHEKFQEEIEFKGERCSLKLPWKEEKALLPTNCNLNLARLKGQIKKLQKDERRQRSMTESLRSSLKKES